MPNSDGTQPLSHADLEGALTDRVLAQQPNRASLGFSEIVMRDIANSVVRELVGNSTGLHMCQTVKKQNSLHCTGLLFLSLS